MTMDFTRLIDRLDPPADGETPVRHRTGIVDAVNSDGTVDLILSGIVVPSVAVLSGASAGVGEVVEVAAWSGDLLVLGTVAADSAEVNLRTYTPVLTGSTTNPSRQLPGSGGSIDGVYRARGGVCDVWVRIVYGAGGGPGSGDAIVSLPVAADTTFAAIAASAGIKNGSAIGTWHNRDNSNLSASPSGGVQLTSTATVRFGLGVGGFLDLAGTLNAASDTLIFQATYPASI